MTDKEPTKDTIKWLEDNAYATKGNDSWFITDFPEEELPDRLIIPITEKGWRAIREVIKKTYEKERGRKRGYYDYK